MGINLVGRTGFNTGAHAGFGFEAAFVECSGLHNTPIGSGGADVRILDGDGFLFGG